jgi:acetolactate synthase-1/2/3 large subunit
MSGAKTLLTTLKTLLKARGHPFPIPIMGYVGGAILPVSDALYGDKDIKFYPSKTEAGGSHAAEGFAKATGHLGIMMSTSGPGVLNTVTSMQNARSDGTPLLVLAGQVSTKVLGTDAFQEAPVLEITKPITKLSIMIKNSSDIETSLETVIDTAFTNRHGPVLLDLPKNIMSLPSEPRNCCGSGCGSCLKENCSKQIDQTINAAQIINLIGQSTRPVILAGQGVIQAKAVHLLRIFSRIYNIPVTTTLMGLGVMNERNPIALKMVGMHGSYTANMAVQKSDLLLNFGSRFDDRIIGDPTKFAKNATIVHVDIEKHNINKVIKTPHYINGDCKDVLLNLIERRNTAEATHTEKQDWVSLLQDWKSKQPFKLPENKPVLQGRKVIAVLNKLIHSPLNKRSKFSIIADVGAHQMWAAQFIDYDYNKVRFITSGGLGTMGFALPASIGVKIGLPKHKVICIVGDGGFTMSYVELLTAIENKINIKVFVINNSYQLMVKMWQDKFYDNRHIGVKMNNPPFEKVCQAMGCKAIRIDSKSNIEHVVQSVLDYEQGPIVVNCITDDSEPVLPMVSPGKAIDEMILEDVNDKLSGDAPC